MNTARRRPAGLLIGSRVTHHLRRSFGRRHQSRIAPTPASGFSLVPGTKRGRKVDTGSVSACSPVKEATQQLRRDRRAFIDFFSVEISNKPS